MLPLVIGPLSGLWAWDACGLWIWPWAWFGPRRWPKL